MSASCAALNRLTRRAPRTLSNRLFSLSRPVASSSLLARSSFSKNSSAPTVPRVSCFSTMSSLQAAAAPSTDKSYDPEIKDMASYIHDYNVNSDLAVCRNMKLR